MATAPAAAAPDAAATPEKKRAMPLWLILVIVVALLGAGGGAFMLLHGFGSSGTHSAHKVPSGPAHYLALKPFVVNFAAGQQVRYLQVTLQVMSHDPKTLRLLKQNNPVVRNDLLLLLSNQSYATLDTEKGKQQLRAAVLANVRKVVRDAGGHPDRVNAIYFTSFVMQ